MDTAPNDSVRTHYQHQALTAAIDRVHTTATDQIRIYPTGASYTRQYARIADALDAPLGTVLDISVERMFPEQQPQPDPTALTGWFADIINEDSARQGRR